MPEEISLELKSPKFDEMLNRYGKMARQNISEKSVEGKIWNTATNKKGIEYAAYLEYGSPTTPAYGMVRNSRRQISQYMSNEFLKVPKFYSRKDLVQIMRNTLGYAYEVIRDKTPSPYNVSERPIPSKYIRTGKLHSAWQIEYPK